tara:strand:+ start:33 stop:728 length:696 start_codon:yes stop_codon:yes gene_type:complete
MSNNTFLAIIPARSGSERLPDKNKLNLCGKPLISWTIEAAKRSKYVNKIAVSSDDSEILKIAKESSVEIISRPDELASNTATSIDVIKHSLEILDGYEYVILLQPTSPLRNYRHIDESIKFLKQKNADAIISVCETNHNPLWSNTLDRNLSMSNFIENEQSNKRSQDLEKFYRLNGAIYICKTKNLLEENTFFIKKNIFAFLMDKKSSIDIDDKLDFEIATIYMSQLVSKQ